MRITEDMKYKAYIKKLMDERIIRQIIHTALDCAVGLCIKHRMSFRIMTYLSHQ